MSDERQKRLWEQVLETLRELRLLYEQQGLAKEAGVVEEVLADLMQDRYPRYSLNPRHSLMGQLLGDSLRCSAMKILPDRLFSRVATASSRIHRRFFPGLR